MNILMPPDRKLTIVVILWMVLPFTVAAATASGAADPRSLNLSLLDAAKKGEAALVESRLLDGASISTRDRFGNTALIYAARGGHFRTARLLIEAGANVNQPNTNGNTPLFEAAGSGNIDLVRLMVEHEADPNLVSMKQVSPLANAVYHQHASIADFLLRHDAWPDFVDNSGKNSAVYAAAMGQTEVLRSILEFGGEHAIAVDTRYAHGLTLLMWAAGYGHAESVNLLVNRGAMLDLTDDRGKTALMMAEENGNADAIQILLDASVGSTGISD